MRAGNTKPALLWVARAPLAPGQETGGDEIYDRRVISVLSQHYNIERMSITRQPMRRMASALLQGLPHPRFQYYTREVVESFIGAAQHYDHVVVSWESFDFLALAANRPTTLIIHNVISDALSEIFPGNIAARLAALQSRLWERRAYGNDQVRIVVLSERDAAIVAKLVPSAEIALAPPGAPKPAVLETPQLLHEVVLSGSYIWYPKRRDLFRIADEYEKTDSGFSFRYDSPLPARPAGSRFASESRLIETADFGQGLRIGLIPDRFLGGFKLKSTYYVAMNCVVASCCDIRDEFRGLPHANEFVLHVKSIGEVADAFARYAAMPQETLFARWAEFKAACLERFNWERSALSIAGTFTDRGGSVLCHGKA